MTVAANVMVVALLVLVCGNVALLIFARAATRGRRSPCAARWARAAAVS
jgi:hypothetical protein